VLTQPSLTITRRLNASPAKVFAAWTDAEKIIRWFGPAHTIDGSVQAEMDVRVGGTLLSLNHGQFFDQAARDGHERGWLGTMDKLERFFA